jgi:hypothetical protein
MGLIKYRTSPEALNAAYAEWYMRNAMITPYYSKWRRTYQQTYRLDKVNQMFELWVQEQGGRILQENKRRFIEFDDESLRLQFVLTWCS